MQQIPQMRTRTRPRHSTPNSLRLARSRGSRDLRILAITQFRRLPRRESVLSLRSVQPTGRYKRSLGIQRLRLLLLLLRSGRYVLRSW